MKIIKENPDLMVLKEKNIIVFWVGIIFALAGVIGIFLPRFFIEKMPLWVGLVFILIGIVVFFNVRMGTVTLDKSTNQLKILWRKLLTKKYQEYALNQIKAVEMKESYIAPSEEEISQTSQFPRHKYNLFFLFENNQEITLDPWTGTTNLEKERTLGETIAKFLNVTFQEQRPPTVGEVLSTVKEAAEEEMQKIPAQSPAPEDFNNNPPPDFLNKEGI